MRRSTYFFNILCGAVILISVCCTAMAEGEKKILDAAKAGDEKAVIALAGKGGEVNAADGRGATALMICAAQGQKDAVNALIKGGADVNKKSAK